MTLAKIIDTLKMIALKHPNVNSAYEGNIYDILNAKPDNRYASVVITQQSHTTDEIYDHYGFVIFYVDRLVDDLEENRVQIQSIGKSMLGNIITAFCNEFEAECENISYQTFTQRFADETAGVYCTITIDTVKDVYCAERYWDESWSAPVVSIKNVDMSITIIENGHYVLEYDPTTHTGIGKVDIDVDFNTEPYYNDGYNNGYDNGKNDGYREGFFDGEQVGFGNGYESGTNEQKSKLESINITENGTYTREDGYNSITVEVPDLNGSYDEGYKDGFEEGLEEGVSNAGGVIAETARVLDITENGIYTCQFSQDDDYNMAQYLSTGDNFKDYAFLHNSAYNTQVPVTIDSRLEFWFRPDIYAQTTSLTIVIKNSNITQSQGFGIQQQTGGDGSYYATIGNSYINFFLDDGKWYHIIMSITDGLIVNDEKIGEFNRGGSVNDVLYINSAPATKSFANGCFGMIKIDNTVIIPIENGFLNKTTNEIIPTYVEGLYEFNPLPITNKEGNLIRTVNVNVTPKISIALTGIKLGYSPFSEIPEYLDFKNVEDMYYMFFNCDKLTKVSHIDTSDVTNMARAFYSCDALKEIELIDTSNVTNMEAMCYDCKSLITFPPLNTSKVTNMREMFRNCNNLVSVSALDARSLVRQNYGIFGSSNLNNLTDFGGLIGLKASMDGNYSFDKVPNLTYESCINILNGLYDFTGNGETPTSNEGKLKVHSNFLSTVGDEISIGVLKGWQISA